jgi:putative CocE/NonD family hydrolase
MTEERVWIPMADGVRLAATNFLPDDRPAPWPAVLEANPYRKDDCTQSYWSEYRRLRDEGGYAVCRVDLRGTGSSEGLATDEYPEQEQDDLCEVVAWLAAQEWSTGAVGMYGASYSGFNSIQVAMRRPPALKAVIPIYATDDRYHDDVHYWGGARRGLDFVDYPTYMVAMNALPPWPSIAGDGWRAQWQARVERLEPWMLRWLEEQVDGPYWRHGSLRPGYDRVACPVMIVAGWADGYRNATFRVFERLSGPKRLLIGPWSHTSTATSLPGPHIDLVPEMIRWWDRWLRDDRGTGLDDEPPIVVFVRRSTRPAPDLAEMRGEWRFEPSWPPERLRDVPMDLTGATGSGDELEVRADVGITGSISCAGHLPFGQPWDQRADEALSLVYDWPTLDRELEIIGHPRLEVTVTSSAPVAFLSAKLCDVFEDGTSALVCRGFLNLTHRESHETPEPLIPGQAYRVAFEMDATSWVFERGHRLRLDLAGADWPNVWPPPSPLTLAVDRAASRLILPVDGPPPIDQRPALPEARDDEKVRGASDHDTPVVWREERDILGRETRVVIDHGTDDVIETGVRSSERYRGVTGVSIEDPGKAWAEGRASFTLEWPEATATSEVRTRLESDASTWHVTIDLDVSENGEPRWSRHWERRFPRNLA